MGLCCSSEQIGKQHKRSAGEVPAGCHNMLVCRRTSVAQSPCLIPLRLPLPFFLTLTSLLSLAHFAVCITYFLSFSLSLCPWHRVSVSLLACLSASPFSFPRGPPSLFSLTPPPPLLALKYVLVGCASCRNASSDCILHPQCSNEAGVPSPSIFLTFLPSFCTLQMKCTAAVNTQSRKDKRKIYFF